MTNGHFLLTSDAPLDDHTAELLRTFGPAEVVVADTGSPAQTLREWSRLATAGEGRLVLADAQLRAEGNALANLLEAPALGSAVLLAHNGVEEANPEVLVAADAVVPDGGAPVPAAGILVIAPEDREVFAAAALRTADEIDLTGAGDADAWELALRALTAATEVRAVPAAPFCASRQAMDLPAGSEDDRRRRMASARPEDPITRTVLRPASRRLTRFALDRGFSAPLLTIAGLGTGIAAAAAILLPGLAGALLGGLLLVCSALCLLSDGEVTRYWRQPSARGSRVHRLVARTVELSVLIALGAAAAAHAGVSWLWSISAVGMVAVLGALAVSRAAVGDEDVHDGRSARWLAIVVALVVGAVATGEGAWWGILAALAGSAAAALVLLVRTARDSHSPAPMPNRGSRFLVPPGSFVDAGLLVRVISSVAPARIPLAPVILVSVAVSAIASGTALAAASGSRLGLLIGAVVAVVALGLVLAAPLTGAAATAMPALVRVLEIAVICGAVAHTGAAGSAVGPGLAGALLAAAVTLLLAETADGWRFLGVAPPPWLALADGGFDGRIVVLGAITAVSLTAIGTGLAVLAGVMALLLIGSLAVYPWRRPTP